MIRPHDIIKHEKFMDVCAYVEKAFYVKEKSLFKLKVSWINMGFNNSYWLNILSNIEIPKTKLSEWKLLPMSRQLDMKYCKFDGSLRDEEWL